MKYLILGDGILSKELVKQTNWKYISRKKNNININNFDELKNYLNPYDIIINTITYTNTYDMNKKKHWNTNYKFVSNLVDYCNENNKKLVHFSTDYVYTNSIDNVSEIDIPIHGNNWYSYTKLLADAYIELKSNNYLIIRGTHKEKPFKYNNAWIDQFGNFDYVDIMCNYYIPLIIKYNGIYNVGTNIKSIYELAYQTNKNVKPKYKPSYVPNKIILNLNKLKNIKIK